MEDKNIYERDKVSKIPEKRNRMNKRERKEKHGELNPQKKNIMSKIHIKE
jgi:hypothetical protein